MQSRKRIDAHVERIETIDLLRGFVMLLMTLDHARDFLGNAFFSATDLSVTTIPIFLSRWITHLCAPTFLFLAGCGIWLQLEKSDVEAVRRFLFIRGCILIMLELTIVHLVWYFHFDMRYAVAGVIWACGWSMVLMSALIGLPKYVLAGLGVTIIAFQPVISNVLPANMFTDILLRTEDHEWMTGCHFYTSYPILPWWGIMCIGYGWSSFFQRPEQQRRRALIYTGVALLGAFVLLRLFSLGDPVPRGKFDTNWQMALSFLNVEKYPPSLDFCLLTIGLSLVIGMSLEKVGERMKSVLLILGRVPLMYYLLHIFVLHLIAIIYAALVFGETEFLLKGPQIFWYEPLQGRPVGYGLPLVAVYFITLIVVILLLPVLKMYSTYKKQHPNSLWRFI